MIKQDTIAIVYDFDGTLSPLPMQEYTILPELNISAEDFWEEVNAIADTEQAEPMLIYMRLLIEKMQKKNMTFSRKRLVNMGDKIQYFAGVRTWFERINNYVEKQIKGQIKIRHYIISAGLKEILEGCSIYGYFHQVYASEYSYDGGQPGYPKMLITDTSKTQFLFRINKGLEKPRENINIYMPENKRPIPFSNIIYIGDGLTDVPSMAVIKQQGGHALSVYNSDQIESSRKGFEVCCDLLKANRIDFFAKADYSENSQLEKLTKLILDYLMQKIDFHNKYINEH